MRVDVLQELNLFVNRVRRWFQDLGLPLRRRGRQAPLQGLPQVKGEGRQEGQEGGARRGAAHSRPPTIRRHGRHLGAP